MGEHYSSPRWSNEVADCSMPMTFDTYSNCSYGCLYCFSQFQRAIGGAKADYLRKAATPVNVQRVKRIFTEPGSSQFWPYIQQRKVFQWGGLSDQFDEFERKQGVTLELLRFFREIDYPICFSTKATWWLDDPRYTELFRNNPKWNMKFSIITLDEAKVRVIEAGVPSPVERLKAIEKFANLNAGGVTLRLRPFIIGVSTPSYLDLIREAGRRGAGALSTEFFCLEQRSPVLKLKMPVFDKLCGFDVMAFYQKYSRGSGYLRLNRNVKQPFIEKMKAVSDEIGMRFYVSDAHFKELCHNGCCCGLPENWNYSRGQWCHALQIAKKNGKVHYNDISAEIDMFLGGFQWARAEGFNGNSSERRAKFAGMTMADYMRWLWNNPQAGQSPYRLFEAIMVPNGKDGNGDLVYEYADKAKVIAPVVRKAAAAPATPAQTPTAAKPTDCGEYKVLTVITGANGSGKSTLARNIIGTGGTVYNDISYGKYTGSIYSNNLIALGKYENDCGGCDGIKSTPAMYNLAVSIARKRPKINIIMEGILISALLNGPLKFYLEMKHQHGYRVEIVHLYTPLKDSLERVSARNGGKPFNHDAVRGKVVSSRRVFNRLAQTGEFHCKVIDTHGKAPSEVFDEFKQWSYLYAEK